MEHPQEYYEEKIRKLQEDVASLRLSRRVLMNVLEQVQSERRLEKQQTTERLRRLQAANTRYARTLWRYNCQRTSMDR